MTPNPNPGSRTTTSTTNLPNTGNGGVVPQVVQQNTFDTGSFGLMGWMKAVGNLTGMTIVAGIACFLLWTMVSELRNDVRELQQRAAENNQTLRDINHEITELRRETLVQKHGPLMGSVLNKAVDEKKAAAPKE